MYVCLCLGISDLDIRETVAEGASSADEVMYCTGAGSRCGTCRATVAAIVADVADETGPVSAASGPASGTSGAEARPCHRRLVVAA